MSMIDTASTSRVVPDAATVSWRTPLRVAPSTPDDRSAIRRVILESGIFGPLDADCVEDLFTQSLRPPFEDNYRFLSCWDDQAPDRAGLIGFACCGREALTQGTWDLFWICVHPTARGKGAGSALLREAQLLALADNARLMVIYTSSTERYAPARRLYQSRGFIHVATVPDYYADGDHLFIYSKRLKKGEE
ncbi:MAG: GNAT family N-acetyltransferase [Anaerolineae bacterium]|nr:GNAT family N-acetyltransferase [Thermoflexales bacterium]MDW8406221.1 GNAT family N-acetyltransferase [Anaerolineae bacterium]